MLRRITFCVVTLLLAACGGSSTLNLQGIWTGKYGPPGANGAILTLKAMVQDGGPTIFFDSSGFTYVAAQALGSNLAAQLTLYPTYGFIFTGNQKTLSASLTGSATASSMDGFFHLTSDGAIVQITMTPSTPFAGTPSVVAGSWQGVDLGSYDVALDVTAAGNITGSDVFGCDFTGTITQVSGGGNLFDVDLQSTGSSFACGVHMTGLAYESDTDEFDKFGGGTGTYYLMAVYGTSEAMVTEFKVQ